MRALIIRKPLAIAREPCYSSFLSRGGKRKRALIISVGAHNPFGHPNPEVFKRYQNLGIKVYRTDKNGAITITTDGDNYWVKTMRKGKD